MSTPEPIPSAAAESTFKSPPHKLIRFFAKSRDAWKAKAKERLEMTRKLNQALRAEEAEVAYWKKRARAAETRAEKTEDSGREFGRAASDPPDVRQKKIGGPG